MKYRQQGFALLLVIWALVLLTSLGLSFAHAIRVATRSAADMTGIARSEAAATAGLHTAILALVDGDPKRRWPVDGRPHTFNRDDIEVTVRIQSEAGLINLNDAPHELLAGLFKQLLPASDPEALADSAIDWRDSDDTPGEKGAEADDYRRAGYTYAPANRPFTSVHELSRVKGFDNTLVRTVSPYLSTYGQGSRINVATAGLVVLSAVPGIEKDDAIRFVTLRDQPSTDSPILEYGALRAGRRYLDTRPDTDLLRIDVEVHRIAGTSQWHEQSVIRLDQTAGYQTLSREVLPVDPVRQSPNG